jgi:SAM-dependent methyltransferase
MRKDYLQLSTTEENEIDFIEHYWTDIWEKEGGPQGEFKKIPSKPEFKIMKPYLNRLQSKARLLDGGCGLGDWTAFLSSLGFSVTGIDISKKTVELLNKHFPETDFASGDIRNLNLSDNSIDGYFSWGVFEHFEEGLQPCIKEALRVLKPGGVLFITVPADNIRQALRGTLEKYSYTSENQSHQFYQWRLTRAELAKQLAIGGFKLDVVKPIHKRQGILRSLHHEFGLPYEWFFTRALSFLLSPLLPGVLVAHMYMAVAYKPANP